jgi:hypothetical protein
VAHVILFHLVADEVFADDALLQTLAQETEEELLLPWVRV